ncbi:MAG: amidohydrolase [Clostridia bacterium]|nr:amidohydrolase [Clostridia bacterium]
MRHIIDCHCHIYPDKIALRAAEATGRFYDIPMACDGTVSMMQEEGRWAGIERFLVFSVATKPEQTSSINRYIAGEVAKHPGVMLGLGTMHPDDPNIAEEAESILSLGLRGVKLHPDIQGVALDDPRCMAIYEACEGRLPMILHTGDYRYDYSNPNRLIPILKRFPRLTVVGAHFGGWSIWEEATEALYDMENFYVDCSSSLYALESKVARRLVRAYGADRVLFGTDYPMWHPVEEVARFDEMGLDDEEEEKILHRNAEGLFGFAPVT